MQTIIKDVIHGDIQLNEFELSLIDTPEFQRLRRVRQLAMAYLVYPGANHSRFEHSLGTMHLTGELCHNLQIEKDGCEKLRVAALLHDVGHVAFSHEGEAAIERETGSHEELGEKVLKNSKLGDTLKQKFSAKEISEFARGTKLGSLIASDLGSDRMDYLNRDSHYTGVAYGVIDSARIIHTLNFSKGKLLLEKGGLEAAEALLIARFLMFSTVYLHKTVRIASGMLQEAMRLSVASGALSPADAVKLDDSQMLTVLKKDKQAAKLVDRLSARQLYKTAYRLNPSSNENLQKLREKIASSAKVDLSDVLLESGGKPTRKFDITVSTSSGEKNIEELSQLVSAVISAEESRRKTIVAAPKEKVEAVKKACDGLFSFEKEKTPGKKEN